jgi:uncharacterized protein
MSVRVFEPQRLDMRAFATESAALEGRVPLARLPRIADAMAADAPSSPESDVAWRARGESRPVRGAAPEPWLHLVAQARVPLQCQRCLQPVRIALEVDRWFRFVVGEDAAARIDADSDDDVLALPKALDLIALVEDELLLALPLVPRHEDCDMPLGPQVDQGDEPPAAKANPFEALAALKRGGSLN